MFEQHPSSDFKNTEKKSVSNIVEEGVKLPTGNEFSEYFQKYLPKKLIEIFSKKKFSFHEKNNELAYETFILGKKNTLGSRTIEAEILISDDAKEILKENKLGKVKIKKIIKEELKGIEDNPYGNKNIDFVLKNAEIKHPKHVDIYKKQRSVNEMFSVEDELDLPIAVKGSADLHYGHKDREDLLDQFVFMKQKKEEWQQIPEYIKKIIGINEVYAAIKYKIKDKKKKYQEWLFMERIEYTDQVKDCRIDHNIFAKKVFGFEIEKHPLLAQIIETELKGSNFGKVVSREGQECYLWTDFKRALEKVGLNLSDIAGRNILISKDGYYTIIDQRDRSKEMLE